MAAKLLNLLTVSSLAVLLCTTGPTAVTAISISGHSNVNARHALYSQVRKRQNSKRCKARHPTPSKSNTPPAPTQGNGGNNNNNGGNTGNNSGNNGNNNSGNNGNNNGGNNGNSGGNNGNNGGNNVPPPGGKGKLCIATPDQLNWDAIGNPNGKIGYVYTWSPWGQDGAKKHGITPVPMLWSEKQADDFKRLVKPGYSTHVIGVNEPDQPGQSNMSPADGVRIWRQYIDPLADQGYTTISPCPTNSPTGTQWLKDFFAQCQGCRIHRVCVHHYSNDAQSLIDHVTMIHNTFQRPVWLTEFACQDFSGQNRQCSRDQTFAYMKRVRDFMDSADFMEVYCPFGAMYNMGNVNPVNQLLGNGGGLNDLGYAYASYYT